MSPTAFLGSLKPVQVPDPLEIRQKRAATTIAESQATEAKQKIADEAALKQAVGTGPFNEDTIHKVYAANPRAGASLAKVYYEGVKSQHDAREADLKAQKEQIALGAQKLTASADALNSITDPTQRKTTIEGMLQQDLIPLEEAQRLNSLSDDQFATEKQRIIMQGVGVLKGAELKSRQLDDEHKRLLEERAAAEERQKKLLRPLDAKKLGLETEELQRKLDLVKNANPSVMLNLVDQVVPPTVKENASLNARTRALVTTAIARGDMVAAQDAIKTASAEMRQLEVATDPRVQQNKINLTIARNDAQTAGASDDDFVRSGEQYARTGVMPPLGMSSAGRTKILHYGNEWARANHLSPSDLITMQAAYKGDIKSLENFQKQRDQIVSFEQTAQKNLDLFLSAAEKIPDTGVPWLNTPLRLLDEKLVGSANMAAVNAARQVANNEIAKVTSGGGLGGVLSDTARKEVAEYNPRNATLGQTIAVAKLLKQDMANRHQSMDATLGDIKSRIGGGGNQPQNPQPGLKPTHRFNPNTGKIEVIP